MAEVDWTAVFQFCAQHRTSFSPEDQKVLTRGMWGVNLALVAGVSSALATDYYVLRLPIVRAASPFMRFNVSALCLVVPALFWCQVGVRRFLKPAFLSVYEKNSGLARP